MPISWQTVTGDLNLPMREWIRSPVIQFSELFMINFHCPDWEQWNKRHRGRCFIRSVWLVEGTEQISPTTAIWIDDTGSPVIVPLPFPDGYLQSGYNTRILEFYRSPTVRRADGSISLSVQLKHSA